MPKTTYPPVQYSCPRLSVGYQDSYGLVTTTLDLQVNFTRIVCMIITKLFSHTRVSRVMVSMPVYDVPFLMINIPTRSH